MKSRIVSLCLIVFLALVVSPVFGMAPAQKGSPAQKGAGAKAATPQRPPAAWIEKNIQSPEGTQFLTFYSPTVKQEVSYQLYLPPDYETAKDKRYPVVYWLHGLGGNQTVFAPFLKVLDPAIKAGTAPAMIVVGVNGMRSMFYCNSKDGKYPVEDVIIKDLIPYIDKTYRTIATREGRGIEGFSMGGFGAAYLGFKYSDMFGVVSPISGAHLEPDTFESRHSEILAEAYGGSKEYAAEMSPWSVIPKNADNVRGRTVVRIVVGDKDQLLTINQKLDALLTELKIEHTFTTVPGAAHNPNQVYPGIADAIPEFYTKAFAAALGAKPEAGQSDAAGKAGRQKAAQKGAQKGAQKASPAAPRPPMVPPSWVETDRSEPEPTKFMTFPSKAVGQDVSFQLYLPPDYETAKDKRYPVIYWLHGRGGKQQGSSTLSKRYDDAIKAGKASGVIIVGINGMRTSSWVDSFDGKTPVESMLVKDLIPYMDSHYRTIAKREARAIEGFSMGGSGAAHFGFKFPEVFGVVSIMAGALHDAESMSGGAGAGAEGTWAVVYGSSVDYFNQQSPWKVVEKNADKIRDKQIVRITVGEKDNLLAKDTEYHQLLEKLGIKHEFRTIPNAVHNAGQLYEGLSDRAISFFTEAFAKVK